MHYIITNIYRYLYILLKIAHLSLFVSCIITLLASQTVINVYYQEIKWPFLIAQDTFNLIMTPSRIFILRGIDKRGMLAWQNEPLLFHTAQCESLIWHAGTLFIMGRNYCQEAWAELTALWMLECYREKKSHYCSCIEIGSILYSWVSAWFFFLLFFQMCWWTRWQQRQSWAGRYTHQ